MADWHIFKGNPKTPHDEIETLPAPPSWRPFGQVGRSGESRRKRRGQTFQARPEEIDLVNAALFLRRPMLITGPPGVGKSSLVYAVAQELKLGEVLYWPITTRTMLKDGLYSYDAIGRLQEAKEKGDEMEVKAIGKYIALGPLGTALLPSQRPRILLIDEIDKSDIDLPNDLLTIFEEGRFEIPELVRIAEEVGEPVAVRTAYTDETESTWAAPEGYKGGTYPIAGGRVTCTAFPFVVMTSNGERDFPPPFLRRCLRLDMRRPTKADLERIVTAHFEAEFQLPTNAQGEAVDAAGDVLSETERVAQEEILLQAKAQFLDKRDAMIGLFLEKREMGLLSTDQLLNAIFMVTRDKLITGAKNPEQLAKQILRSLTPGPDPDLEQEAEDTVE